MLTTFVIGLFNICTLESLPTFSVQNYGSLPCHLEEFPIEACCVCVCVFMPVLSDYVEQLMQASSGMDMTINQLLTRV